MTMRIARTAEPLQAALLCLVVAAALGGGWPAQAQSARFFADRWTLNPGAERSLVLETGELLPPLGFRASLGSHLLWANTEEGGVGFAQLREHLTLAFAPASWLQVDAQLPAVLASWPAHSPPRGLARAWLDGRVGILSAGSDDPVWLSLSLAAGFPGLSHAEADGSGQGWAGGARVSLGIPFDHGVVGFDVGLQLSSERADLRGGATLASKGGHLRGEVTLRGELEVRSKVGFAELLGGVRYRLRPLELFLLAGPGFGLYRAGPSVRALGGLSFLLGGEDEASPAQPKAAVECHPDIPYRLADCPDLDFDNDGVKNRDDACPTEYGPKENQGCPWPDTDGDTLIDRFDNCPTERGPVENQGCPWSKKQLVVIKPERLEILDKVYFEFDKATLLPESFPLLTQVAAVILAHPELKVVRVDGHTDNIGGAAYNKDLSTRRAESVRTFLIQQGVAPERLSFQGFGFERPIATNDTEEGRGENRRVEFLIIDPPPPPAPER